MLFSSVGIKESASFKFIMLKKKHVLTKFRQAYPSSIKPASKCFDSSPCAQEVTHPPPSQQLVLSPLALLSVIISTYFGGSSSPFLSVQHENSNTPSSPLLLGQEASSASAHTGRCTWRQVRVWAGTHGGQVPVGWDTGAHSTPLGRGGQSGPGSLLGAQHTCFHCDV